LSGDRRSDRALSERRHESVFPGFKEMAERRRELAAELVVLRRAAGLSQTEVAARMGTSQSAVARIESGDADVRLSTLDRYAVALGHELDIRLKGEPPCT
jgi:predicted transcriptional regulator